MDRDTDENDTKLLEYRKQVEMKDVEGNDSDSDSSSSSSSSFTSVSAIHRR